jgi:uncharacterized protein (TIGR02452 family)
MNRENEHPALWRAMVWNETNKQGHLYPFGATQKYTHDPSKLTQPKQPVKTIIEITEEDTIVAGERLRQLGYNPVLLIFADNMHAGGSVDVGSGAQEESLWRRTNLYCTQTDDFYPLNEKPVQEGLYIKLATVFKNTESNRCALLNQPYQQSFVAVPGLRNPILQNGKLSNSDRQKLVKKIELIFQIALENNHDSIVLGALGCGAWRNPPSEVAGVFKEVCGAHNGLFKCLTFACYGANEFAIDGHSPLYQPPRDGRSPSLESATIVYENRNYNAFKQVFG